MLNTNTMWKQSVRPPKLITEHGMRKLWKLDLKLLENYVEIIHNAMLRNGSPLLDGWIMLSPAVNKKKVG